MKIKIKKNKKAQIKIVVLGIAVAVSFILFFIAYARANPGTTEISNCSALDQAGETYLLTADIIDATSQTCMDIQADNITLDCQGHTIDGVNTFDNSLKGISGEGNKNITIKNCKISDYLYSFSSIGDYSTIFNNNFFSNYTDEGGYSLDLSSRGSLFYNNLFNITSKFYITGSCSGEFTSCEDVTDLCNYYGELGEQCCSPCSFNGTDCLGTPLSPPEVCSDWADGQTECNILTQCSWGYNINYFNTSKQTGTRVFSNGNNIGGNYWTNSTESYSDTCTDANTDGFCDSPLDLETGLSCTAGVDCGNNVDYLPLSNKYSSGTTGAGGYCIIKDSNSINIKGSGMLTIK